MSTDPAPPDFEGDPLRVLEDDENIPPRPEEEIAEAARAVPDPGADPH